MSRAKLSENQHRITAKIIQMCLPSSKIWNLILISDNLAKFLSEAQIHFVSVVSLGLFGLAGLFWFGQCVMSNCQIQFKESVKVHCWSFCAKTKKCQLAYWTEPLSRQFQITIIHYKGEPLSKFHPTALDWFEPKPTSREMERANCATRNFQLFSRRGQPIPHKHHHWC